MDKIECPICFSESRFWDSAQEDILTRHSSGEIKIFKIYKCNGCGHGFIYPNFKNNEELMKLYDETYGKTYDPDVDEKSIQLRDKQYSVDVELVKKYLSKERITVLDVGCSTGLFLNNMPSNWDKFGYDIIQYYLDYIKDNYKDITPLSETSKMKNDFFDLITLRGVIEHMFDFSELFLLINKKLKKDGIIFICATPDFNSPCSYLYKSNWNQIDPPFHYHQFTATSITMLFAKHGFGLKALNYQYLETPYANFHNDADKYIKNIKRYYEKKDPTDTIHAYPGNMMSLIFEKIKIK
ncbi:hypothetical protein LCGC14_0712390 [marine sediment metagenome]|uniref:Methyltransferase type 11 domain-containing protein n=1 Tax=marine sediment metagenome TaxID=412755 RepID=A0A0F9T0C4_9ZZZZ